ncbi:hypothetical protein I4U23_013435 [Adineta vaga]|nr:hypothetical protein I4U23_013435 [Adineta vaga]
MALKRYLSRKFSDHKQRLTNILPTVHLRHRKRSKESFRHHRIYRTDQLPPKVDLRPDMTPIENQLDLGSSVANCLAGAYEYLTKKATGSDIHVSRLFIDYNARILGCSSRLITDSGCSVINGIEALEEFGVCLESLWPYDITCVNIRPDDEAYEQAKNHKINEVSQLHIDLNEMKSCLAQGFPFAFALKLNDSFMSASKNGIISMLNTPPKRDQLSIGSHALLAVGYSDRSNAFIVRNSWGHYWGDKGYCYIPYEYMTNPEVSYDIWTIRKVSNDSFGREYWHFDDIVNYLNENSIEKNHENDSDDDDENEIIRTDYRRWKNSEEDAWNEYQNLRERRSLIRYDDDYINQRYRRDRYDRDNEPYDQRCEDTLGYINNGFDINKNYSSSIFDQYQDQFYNNSTHNRFGTNNQNFMF